MDEKHLADELQKKLEAVQPGERRLTDPGAYEQYPRDLIKIFDDFARDHPGFAQGDAFRGIAENWNRRLRAWASAPLPPRLPTSAHNRFGYLSRADAAEEAARSGGVVEARYLARFWGQPIFLGFRVAQYHPGAGR